MAYLKLGLTDLIAAIQKKIEDKTKIKCYDSVSENTASPFYFAEVIQTLPANTKTMWRDVFKVRIHAISEPEQSSVKVYEMIESLQEAMTEEIILPDGFELIMQTDGGVQNIKTDETKERHAILTYEFMVCYGFRCKI